MANYDPQLIRSLRRIGLTEYEAEVYLTLLNLGSASASDISKKCKVPVSKIYEVIRLLSNRGLVEIQPSRPKKFHPLDPAKTIKPHIKRIKSELDSLAKLVVSYYKNPHQTAGKDIFWLFNGKKELKIKTEELINNAQKELLIIAQELHYIDLDLIKKLPSKIDLKIASNINFNSPLHRSIAKYLKDFGAELKLYSDKDLWVICTENAVLIATPYESTMKGIYVSENGFFNILRKIFKVFWKNLKEFKFI